MQTASRKSQQSAIDKAREMGGARAAFEVAEDVYEVPASDGGGVYTVTVTDHGRTYTCTCPAGKNDRPCCKHRGCVWLRRMGEGRLPGPKPTVHACTQCGKSTGDRVTGLCAQCELFG